MADRIMHVFGVSFIEERKNHVSFILYLSSATIKKYSLTDFHGSVYSIVATTDTYGYGKHHKRIPNITIITESSYSPSYRATELM